MDLPALTLSLCLEGLDATHVVDDEIGEYVNVSISVDDRDDDLAIQITPVELSGRGVGDELEMLQLYVGIPAEIDPDDLEPLVATLPTVNRMLPIGAYSVIGDPAFVYLRDVILVPRSDIADTIVAEAVWLLHYGLDLSLAAITP